MKDINRTKKELLDDLKAMRQRVSELEESEAERKGAENTLKESEGKYRLIGENTTDFISIISLDGKYIYASPSYKELGYDPAELIGSDGFEILHPDDKKRWLPMLKQVASGLFKKGASERIEIRIRDKAGKYHNVESVGRLIKDDAGEFQILSVIRDITERKRAEKELLDSYNQRDSIFRAAPVGIGVVIDRIFQMVNERFCRMLGYAEKELVGQLSRIVYPSVDEFERVGKYKYEDIQKRGTGTIETVLQKKDGSQIDVLLSSTPMDTQDPSQGVTFTALDITKRVQAEENLRKSENLLNDTQQITKMGGWTWNVENQTMFWSDETYRIHEIDPIEIEAGSAEHIERGVKCYDKKDRQIIMNAFHKCANEGIPYDLEFPFTTAKGKRIWIRTIAQAEKENDKVVNVTGNIMDITKQVQARKALRESEKRFRNLYEAMPLGYQSLDADGRILDVNDTWLGMLGYIREEVMGRWFGNFLHPEEEKNLMENFTRFIEAGEIREIEYKMLCKDGSLVVISFDGRVGYDENMQFKQTHCILKDITKRVQVDEEIKQRTEDLALINTLNAAINHGDSLPEVIQQVSGEMERIFSCLASTLYLLSEDKNYLILQKINLPPKIKKGIEKIIGTSIPEVTLPLKKESLTQKLLKDGKPRLINDPEEIQAWMLEFTNTPKLPENLRRGLKTLIPKIYKLIGVRSVITIPLILDTEPVGLLDVSRREPFTETDMRRVAGIAGPLSSAIQRVQTEKELQGSEYKFRLLADHTYDWEYWINPEGNYIYISPSCERITGFTPEAFKANPELINDLVRPDYTEQIYRHYRDENNSDIPIFMVEFPIITKNGEERWIAHHCSPVFDETGNYAGRRGNNRDITKRKQAEAQLKLQAHALESAANAIAITDDQGNILWANPAFSTLTGFPLEEALGENPRFLKSGQHDEAFYKQMWDTILTGDVWQGEIVNKRKDGALYTEEMTIAPLISDDGQITNFVAIKQDITERKETEEVAKQHVERLRALRKIDEAISNSLDLKVTLHVLLDYLLAQLGVDAATVLLYEKSLQELTFSQGQGFHTAALKKTILRLGDGYAGKVALKREDVFIPDLIQATEPLSKSPLFEEEGFVAYYGVPLIAKGTLVGVLEIFNRSSLAPNDEWVSYLHTLAGQAAIAIDNISLFNDLQRSNTNLLQAYNATIEGWAQALELRDMETEGHSRRVVKITMALAKKQGIKGQDLVNTQRGALLHDIGKMGIPDAILQKPGKLNAEEWKIMKLHPVYAFEWLSSIEYLRPALDIPHYHHEKWDGTGYPDGLKAEQIPIAARIFAIVDVWDALLSDRPYRKAWPREKTLAYIQEESGKYFDPEVVDAFLHLIKGRDNPAK